MKVAVIGAGHMGKAFAHRLSASGHEVAIAAKDKSHAESAAKETGHAVTAVDLREAAAAADVIIAATPYPEQAKALQSAGDLAGKVVIEISNPVTPDFQDLSVGHTTSAAEKISEALPNVKLVKAFNTVFAQVLTDGPDFGGGKRVPAFYAGDDPEAKAIVKGLIESMGFEAVDAGPLRHSRLLEPLGMLNIIFAYHLGRGTGIAPAWIRRG